MILSNLFKKSFDERASLFIRKLNKISKKLGVAIEPRIFVVKEEKIVSDKNELKKIDDFLKKKKITIIPDFAIIDLEKLEKEEKNDNPRHLKQS